MVTISRRLALHLRAVMRRAFGNRGLGPAICFTASAGTLSVRASSGDVAVEYTEPASAPAETLRLPFEFLADCEGKTDEPVHVEVTGKGRVTAQWRDGNVPQLVRYDVPEERFKAAFPVVPDTLQDNPPGILTALHDAVETADKEATRYAINCVQIRGASGTIAAMDGRQLLVQDGFQFPWDEELLIPGTTAFGCKELRQEGPVRIGRSDGWVTVQAGPWVIHLAINKTGRFPNLEHHIARAADAVASCSIAPADAQFLMSNLPRLPNDDVYNDPVTLDLNGSIAVRARGDKGSQVTELILAASSWTGQPLCVNSNRRYLARAVRLGFDRLHLFGPRAPVLCEDDRRKYAWALLEPESAIGPTDDALRITSAGPEDNIQSTKPKIKRRTKTVSGVNDNPNGEAKANGQAPRPRRRKMTPKESTALIEQAEAVLTAARELAGKTAELVRSLKQHRRESRIVASTLKQLRSISV